MQKLGYILETLSKSITTDKGKDYFSAFTDVISENLELERQVNFFFEMKKKKFSNKEKAKTYLDLKLREFNYPKLFTEQKLLGETDSFKPTSEYASHFHNLLFSNDIDQRCDAYDFMVEKMVSKPSKKIPEPVLEMMSQKIREKASKLDESDLQFVTSLSKMNESQMKVKFLQEKTKRQIEFEKAMNETDSKEEWALLKEALNKVKKMTYSPDTVASNIIQLHLIG